MPTSEQELESWIAARKQSPPAHLSRGVMAAIRSEAQPLPQAPPELKPPSPLLASACLLAGIGKISLILHLAF